MAISKNLAAWRSGLNSTQVMHTWSIGAAFRLVLAAAEAAPTPGLSMDGAKARQAGGKHGVRDALRRDDPAGAGASETFANTLVFGSNLTGSITTASLLSFDNGFTYARDSTNAIFTITTIPEPSAVSAAVGLLGLLAGAAWRRGRHRRTGPSTR